MPAASAKRYADFTAVDHVGFDVAQGVLRLPRAGAGKTTTMRMIGCVSPVTKGTLNRRPRSRAGRVTHPRPARGRAAARHLDEELTTRENLIIYGRYFGLPRSEAGAARTSCSNSPSSRTRQRSGRAAVRRDEAPPHDRPIADHDPRLLLLDEPTAGLDPQARHLVWDQLYRLKQRGVTLVLTTHYMDRPEQLCDRLVVMDKATIVAEGRRAVLAATPPARSPNSGSPRGSRTRSTGSSTASASGSSTCPIASSSTRGRRRSLTAVHARGSPAGNRAGPAVIHERVPAADGPVAHRMTAIGRSTGSLPSGAAPSDLVALGDRARLRVPPARLPADLPLFDLQLVRRAGAVPGRDGRRPRHARKERQRRARRGQLPDFSRLACVRRRHADRLVRIDLPDHGRLVWNRVYHAMYATPLRPRTLLELAWIVPGAARFGRVRAGHGSVRCRGLAADRVGDPGRRPDGSRLRRADRSVLGYPAQRRTRSMRSSASGSRRCSCSRARSSPSISCRRSSRRSRGSRRCTTASP